MAALATVYIESTLDAFQSNKKLADKAIAQLSDEQLRIALDPNVNSIAVIMKHVAGNLISRWTDFLIEDGEKPWRGRDDEFIDTFRSRQEILDRWEQGWNCALGVIGKLTADDLQKTVTIRGVPHPVPLAIQRSLAHICYHIGQIVQAARVLAGDHWNTLTIARGQSQQYNDANWGKG
jgi:hypothetical protein